MSKNSLIFAIMLFLTGHRFVTADKEYLLAFSSFAVIVHSPLLIQKSKSLARRSPLAIAARTLARLARVSCPSPVT